MCENRWFNGMVLMIKGVYFKVSKSICLYMTIIQEPSSNICRECSISLGNYDDTIIKNFTFAVVLNGGG